MYVCMNVYEIAKMCSKIFCYAINNTSYLKSLSNFE